MASSSFSLTFCVKQASLRILSKIKLASWARAARVIFSEPPKIQISLVMGAKPSHVAVSGNTN